MLVMVVVVFFLGQTVVSKKEDCSLKSNSFRVVGLLPDSKNEGRLLLWNGQNTYMWFYKDGKKYIGNEGLIGRTIEFTSQFIPKSQESKPWQKYLAQCIVTANSEIILTSTENNVLLDLYGSINFIKFKIISSLGESRWSAFVTAGLLGEDFLIPKTTQENLISYGVIHLLVVSGGNYDLLSGVFRKLLHSLPRYTLLSLECVFFFIYFMLVGVTNLPAFRGFLSKLICNLHDIFGIKKNFLIVSIFVVVIILAINPFSVASNSLWLSVSAAGCVQLCNLLFARTQKRINNLGIPVGWLMQMVQKAFFPSNFNWGWLHTPVFNLFFSTIIYSGLFFIPIILVFPSLWQGIMPPVEYFALNGFSLLDSFAKLLASFPAEYLVASWVLFGCFLVLHRSFILGQMNFRIGAQL